MGQILGCFGVRPQSEDVGELARTDKGLEKSPEPEVQKMEGGRSTGDAVAGFFASGLWDSPLVTQIAFPGNGRTAEASFLPDPATGPGRAGIVDGFVPVQWTWTLPKEKKSIGYRLFRKPGPLGGPLSPSTVIMMFHGNAEIVSDYDGHASLFHQCGASLLVVDFRGYGFSTATNPTLTTLCPDAEAVAGALDEILRSAGYHAESTQVILFGRSIGATGAIHLASHPQYSTRFTGIILESPMLDLRDLPIVQQVAASLPGGAPLINSLQDPFHPGTMQKLVKVKLPSLFIHGEIDDLIPITQSLKGFSLMTVEERKFKRFARAGHNDLLYHYLREYFTEVAKFVRRVYVEPPPPPALNAEELSALSIRELKQIAADRNIDSSVVFEKTDLIALIVEAAVSSALDAEAN